MRNNNDFIDNIKAFISMTSEEENINNLHELMMGWLISEKDNSPGNDYESMIITYRSLRYLLKNLNLFEKQFCSDSGKVTSNDDEENFKDKYFEALKEIKQLKETNIRLRASLN